MNDDPSIDQLAAPLWWTKRLAAAFGVMLVAILVLRITAASRANQQLAGAEAAIKARGGPWTIDDLAIPPLLPGQPNAATLYQQAFTQLNADHTGPSNSYFDYQDERSSEIWHWLALGADVRYQRVFALVHQAALVPDCDWGTQAGSILYTLRPYLGQSRELVNEIADDALYQHFNGDDATCIRLLGDGMRLSKAMVGGKAVIDQMVAIGIMAKVLNSAKLAAADLRTESPAVVDDARQLITRLAADKVGIRDGSLRSLDAESVYSRDVMTRLQGLAWLTSPLFTTANLDLVRLQDAEAILFTDDTGTKRDDFRALHTALGGNRTPTRFALWPETRPQRGIVGDMHTGIDRYAEVERRIELEIDVARVMLATRMFFVEHHHWPKSVDELVPDYLPAVPANPFRPKVNRLEFTVIPHGRPDGADRPMVYCDLRNSHNLPANGHPAIDWQADAGGAPGQKDVRADEDGRQWRDVSVWPLAAYPASVRSPAVASDEDSSRSWENWGNPGNPAALKQAPEYPQKAQRPRDGQ